LFLARECEGAEEGLRLPYGQRRDLIDRATRDLDITGLAAESRAAAIRTCEVSAVTAQEHTDVHLVFLPLEPAEETADAIVVVTAFDDESLLLISQARPRNVQPELRHTGRSFQFRELGPVVRFAPRLDRALRDRFGRIGHDQIHVELDDVAEAVAGRARTERVVER